MTAFQAQVVMIGHRDDDLYQILLDFVVRLAQKESKTRNDNLLLVEHLFVARVYQVFQDDQRADAIFLVVLFELLQKQWKHAITKTSGQRGKTSQQFVLRFVHG